MKDRKHTGEPGEKQGSDAEKRSPREKSRILWQLSDLPLSRTSQNEVDKSKAWKYTY